ncbi:MAG: hypothetical protein KDD82_03955 [Planctomycetes bacterium]|nr:hypothetical protein [Planctomycetota bacterium]
MTDPRHLELYKKLFLDALLDDGVVTESEEASLADFAKAVGLADDAVRRLRAEVVAEPAVAAQLRALQQGAGDEPPEGPPDEADPDFAAPDGPGWESDELQRPDFSEPDGALSARRSRLRALRELAREVGCRVDERDASCRVVTCDAEDPEVQARLRQAAGELELEFRPLSTGPGGLAAVWPEAGRNLLREVKASAGWRLAFVPSYVTPDRRLERVSHKQGWLYFRADEHQGVYVRFGSKRGAQVSVFVGFGSEEFDDPRCAEARAVIAGACDRSLGEGWRLEEADGRLEAKRVLSCEDMTDPAVALSVADALARLAGYVAQHVDGATPRP